MTEPPRRRTRPALNVAKYGSVYAPKAPTNSRSFERALARADSGAETVTVKDSANERARELTNLHAKFIVEPDEMSPAAASYFRRRPWLTPGVAKQWRVGYLPKDSGGDRSGGTMRGKIVYPLIDANGDVLTWFGRDPEFEANHQKWLQSGRAGAEPIKTRFVKGFHRGLELFGQHRDWQALREREVIDLTGLYSI